MKEQEILQTVLQSEDLADTAGDGLQADYPDGG